MAREDKAERKEAADMKKGGGFKTQHGLKPLEHGEGIHGDIRKEAKHAHKVERKTGCK